MVLTKLKIMNKDIRRALTLSFSLLLGTVAFAQDNLMAELENGAPKQKDYAFATFKSTRLIDGSSVECLGKGVLDFRISHRFGDISQGLDNFFGIDNAYTKLNLDYGITRWLMVGIGHSGFNKEDDGCLKIKLLRQENKGGMPITESEQSPKAAPVTGMEENSPPISFMCLVWVFCSMMPAHRNRPPLAMLCIRM